MSLNPETMKVELEAEACCVCGETGEELCSPEEFDAGAPSSEPPLRAVLLHLNHSKMVPSGRLCAMCIRRAQEAYRFSATLAAKGPPPLSEKIRALRRRLHELTQKIDVFIVVGGAGGAYREEDIIMVEKEALAAATRADSEELVLARSLRGEHCYQCTVCPTTFQRGSEYRAHMESHEPGAVHSCWTCGAQFTSHAAATEHAAEHVAGTSLSCQLCQKQFQTVWEERLHEASCPPRCPACPALLPSRAALRTHVTQHDTTCAECFRTFPSASERAAHQLAHRQARHFLCGYTGCILRFTTRTSLVSHLRKCHGAAPSPAPAAAPAAPGPAPAAGAGAGLVHCDSCDRTFGSAAAMKRHARVHLKQPASASLASHQDTMEWGGAKEVWEEGRVEYLEVETLEDMDDSMLQ